MTAWEQIVKEHGPAVWRTAYRLTHNAADADECLQETFVSALWADRRQAVTNWPGMLTCIATAKAIDCLRKRRRLRSRMEAVDITSVPSGSLPPDHAARNGELSRAMRMALASIPPKQAQAFCLRFVSELSYEEVARQLQISVNEVGVILHRARGGLRDLLVSSTGRREPRDDQ